MVVGDIGGFQGVEAVLRAISGDFRTILVDFGWI